MNPYEFSTDKPKTLHSYGSRTGQMAQTPVSTRVSQDTPPVSFV